MFKRRKRFKCHGERETFKREAFDGTKKSKLLKYILPPVLIAFFLLLILLNVNFDNEIYARPQTNAMLHANEKAFMHNQKFELFAAAELNDSMKNKGEIVNTELQTTQSSISSWRLKIKRFALSPPNNFASIPIQECNANSENCTFSCTYGDNHFFPDPLNDLQEKCPNTDLSLAVNKFEFLKGILKKTFFDGKFSLKYLAINECNLQTIQDATFTHANVKNLQTLKLTNNQLLMLQASTLAGLTNIRYFEFKQLPLQKGFKGKEFLKPLMDSVTQLIIQPSINSTIITDPRQWWQNLILNSVIHLDLSNTNFQNILTANTFLSFPALETLLLFNCNMQNFVSKTFDAVANTLKYLDLRFNHLTTLDAYFLYMMGSRNVNLNVEVNEWFCECDSKLFDLLESYNANMMEEIICYSPQQYHELDLKQLYAICQSSGTTALTTTHSSNTSNHTPNITIPTTTASLSTAPTSLDPNSTNQTTITTWETSPTTTTLETSSTTTTLKPHPTVSPPNLTSTSTTTKPIYTTTTSLPIITETITIICYKNIHKTDIFKTHIVKETLTFTIHTSSSTSVRIEFPLNEQWQAFTMLYFTNYNDSQSINAYTRSNEAFPITITNLQSSKVYLFCVIKDSLTAISPYDCHGHYLAGMEPKSWLFQQDKAWFLTTCILAALIVLVCSVFAVYCLLRRHPSWLRKHSERILPVHNRPSLSTRPASQSSSNYLPRSVVKADVSPGSCLYISKHTVPLRKAPKSSPSTSRAKAFELSPGLSKTTLPPPTNARLHGCKVNCLSRISDHHYEEVNF